MSQRNIERFYNVAYNSLFTINGTLSYDRVTDCLIKLANELSATDTDEEDVWTCGEFNEAALADLIVGAYWHYTEWHGGQDSKTYAALCALGGIFSPGMADGPDPDSAERCAYDALEAMAETA